MARRPTRGSITMVAGNVLIGLETAVQGFFASTNARSPTPHLPARQAHPFRPRETQIPVGVGAKKYLWVIKKCGLRRVPPNTTRSLRVLPAVAMIPSTNGTVIFIEAQKLDTQPAARGPQHSPARG